MAEVFLLTSALAFDTLAALFTVRMELQKKKEKQ